jgi:hypothetical protein
LTGNLRLSKKYLPYILDSTLPTGGNGLNAVDLHLRNKYYVTLNSNGVPFRSMLGPVAGGNARTINDSDGPISMENILYTNNTRSRVVPGGWYKDNNATERAFNSERIYHGLSPFTAQTVVAASYGLMQVLYTTAVDATYTMNNGDVGRPPDGLFNENASLDLGTATLVNKYRLKPSMASQFTRVADLANAWCKTLVRYNGAPTYGPSELITSDAYFPTK